MFTGIVSAIGKINSITHNGSELKLSLSSRTPGYFNDLVLGQSIMVDGVCLTATTLIADEMTADVMIPTYQTTTFKNLNIGDLVHLEKAMAANGRFDGHIVSGHVDGIGKLIERKQEADTLWLKFQTSWELNQHIVGKGSIAIDGMSLTVVDTHANTFRVALIPHTQDVTKLAHKSIGEEVNLETDILAKYLLKGRK